MHTSQYSKLIGKILKNVERDNNEVSLMTQDNDTWIMYNDRDDDYVILDKVIGDLNVLVGSPITSAYSEEREASLDEINEQIDDGVDATSKSNIVDFHIKTETSAVIIRFFCVANEGQAPRVDFRKIK